jgi:hypothetical protein
MEYDLASTLVYWLVFLPAMMMLPIAYSMWVLWDVYRRKLLPPMGRRRALVLYFSRLIFVYIFMWTPFLAICTIGNVIPLNEWVYWSGAAWSHFQGIVSCCFSAQKADIKESVLAFLTCREENDVNMSGPQRLSVPNAGGSLLSISRRWSDRMSFFSKRANGASAEDKAISNWPTKEKDQDLDVEKIENGCGPHASASSTYHHSEGDDIAAEEADENN